MAHAPAFAGDIPEKYDRHLGPILFEPYAADLAARIPKTAVEDVLELACGTGISTKHLRRRLPDTVRLVATDLSEAMLGIAKRRADVEGKVEWKVVDATELPFKKGSFDYVACQFGVMFFPDKPAAFGEILRVLRPRGRFIFNVWTDHERNDYVRIAKATLIPLFESDPPRFLDVPYGYHDQNEIRGLLREAGFVDVAITEVEKPSIAQTAREAAAGYVEGSPMATEIRERLGREPSELTGEVENAIVAAFGKRTPIKAAMSALVVSARKPS